MDQLKSLNFKKGDKYAAMGWVFGRFSTVLHPKATSKLLNHSLGHGPGPRWGTSSILDSTVPLTQDLIRISWVTQKRSTKLKIGYQNQILP